ncbi:MAG: MFS transporter [Deltaproteobacteria bacterium]|nr:MFS transporter [Deltaproteobacteria bacterium]
MSSTSKRGLSLLWAGQLLSGIGDRLHAVALMWIAVEAVGERAGFVAAAGPAAQLLLGLLGGVYADRWDKRRAMLVADLLRTAAVASLAAAAAPCRSGTWLRWPP